MSAAQKRATCPPRIKGVEQGIASTQHAIIARAQARGMGGLRALATAIAPWLLDDLTQTDDAEHAAELILEALAHLQDDGGR